MITLRLLRKEKEQEKKKKKKNNNYPFHLKVPMATRADRSADKKQVERHLKILTEMVNRPENKYCADCKGKDPRWASANLGVFICIRCSGIHRSMGTHITKVKSINLDTWTPEQIEVMQKWGNKKANDYWEHTLGENYRPPESGIEQWIRAKYERKQFARKGPCEPLDDASSSKSSEAVAAPAAKQPTAAVQQPQQPAARVAPPPSASTSVSHTAPAATAAPSKPSNDLLDVFGAPPAHAQPSSTLTGEQAFFANFGGDNSSSSAHAPASEKKSNKDSILALFGQSQPSMTMHHAAPPVAFQPGVVMGSSGFAPQLQQAPRHTGIGMDAFDSFGQHQQHQQPHAFFGAGTPGAGVGAGAPAGFASFGASPSSTVQQQQQALHGFAQFGAAAPTAASSAAPNGFAGFASFGSMPQQQQQHPTAGFPSTPGHQLQQQQQPAGFAAFGHPQTNNSAAAGFGAAPGFNSMQHNAGGFAAFGGQQQQQQQQHQQMGNFGGAAHSGMANSQAFYGLPQAQSQQPHQAAPVDPFASLGKPTAFSSTPATSSQFASHSNNAGGGSFGSLI